MKNYSCIAIIPARSGSKRIPKKNIKLFAGKPVIAYPIETALSSGLFDHIIVTTDSEEIAEVAKHYGAEVPFFRPKYLADDFTATAPVILHSIDALESLGISFQFFYCIYPPNPFLQIDYLKKGYDLIIQDGIPSAFTVTPFPSSIFRAMRINTTGWLEMIWPEHRLTRSQDLPDTYLDAGQFYCAKTSQYREAKRFGMKEAHPIILPPYLVHDIDTEDEWKRAELVYLALNNKDNSKG